MLFKLVATIFMLLISTNAASDTQPHATVVSYIENNYALTEDVAQKIWDYAELGYQEYRSSQLIQNILKDDDFSVTAGIAGIPTAFVASWGEEGPVIAILAEYDALPGLSQSATPVQQSSTARKNGHGCGHNLIAAGSVIAVKAIKHYLDSQNIRGTIRLYGTPAEEGGSGKVYMVREGLFEDVDIVLHWHPSDANDASPASTLANRSAKFRFKGIPAHAAGSPEKGRSALDGVEAFNYMINLMREHIDERARIHYIISNGGSAPNVVPEFAEVLYYVRHPNVEALKKLWGRVENAARAAAMGTGVNVDWEIIHGNYPILVNDTLGQLLDKNLHGLGGVEYSSTEKTFATEVFRSFSSPQKVLGSEEKIQPYLADRVIAGSTDVGDVSVVVPTGGFTTATFIPGTSLHSWQSTATSGMSIGVKGAELAAKVLALSSVDLFKNADLREKILAEFNQRRGQNFFYEPLLGDRAPPLNYRASNYSD